MLFTLVVSVNALAAPALLVKVTALLVRSAGQVTPLLARLLARVTLLTETALRAS